MRKTLILALGILSVLNLNAQNQKVEKSASSTSPQVAPAQSVASPQSVQPANKNRSGKRPTVEERAKANANKLTKELSLNADQSSKAYNAILVRMQKIEEVKANKKEMTDTERSQVKEIRESFKNEMKSILTAEQFEKWKNARKHSPERQSAIDKNPNMNPNKKEEPSDLD